MSQTLEGDRSGFAEARETERTAIEAAVGAATDYLEDADHPPGDDARRKITETLRSATVDDNVADLLRRGVLDADKSAIGFGFGFGPVPSIQHQETGRRPGRGDAARPERTRSAGRRERQRGRLTTQIEHLLTEARAAHQAAEQAQREANRLTKRAAVAEGRVSEARRRLEALNKEP